MRSIILKDSRLSLISDQRWASAAAPSTHARVRRGCCHQCLHPHHRCPSRQNENVERMGDSTCPHTGVQCAAHPRAWQSTNAMPPRAGNGAHYNTSHPIRAPKAHPLQSQRVGATCCAPTQLPTPKHHTARAAGAPGGRRPNRTNHSAVHPDPECTTSKSVGMGGDGTPRRHVCAPHSATAVLYIQGPASWRGRV